MKDTILSFTRPTQWADGCITVYFAVITAVEMEPMEPGEGSSGAGPLLTIAGPGAGVQMEAPTPGLFKMYTSSSHVFINL